MSNFQKLIAGTTTLVAPTDPSIVNNDIILSCDSTLGAITINLPSIASLNTAGAMGIRYVVNDRTGMAGTNNITIVPNAADSLNNAANIVIKAANGSAAVSVSDLNDWIGEISTGGLSSVSNIATVAGLTTGTITNGNVFTAVTAGVAPAFITLPAAIPGTIVNAYVGANGFSLQTSNPATIGINGGIGAGFKSVIPADTYIEMRCVSPTQWIGTQYTTAGVASPVAVAS